MSEPFEVFLGPEKLWLSMSPNAHLTKDSWNCLRHSNADYELHFVLRGNCDIDVEDQRYTLSAKQAILIPPGHYHLPSPRPGDFERLSVSFIPTAGPLKQQLDALKPKCRIFTISDEIHSVCSDIFRECAGNEAFQQDMLSCLSKKLLILNFRILRLLDFPKIKQDAVGNSVFTGKIDNFFEAHMDKTATADLLAEELHLSRRQLDRVLRQNYGMGFREKLIRTRMDRASWLLRNSLRPVYEIAFEVGYSSEAAFFSVFKEHYKETPARHRQKYLSGNP